MLAGWCFAHPFDYILIADILYIYSIDNCMYMIAAWLHDVMTIYIEYDEMHPSDIIHICICIHRGRYLCVMDIWNLKWKLSDCVALLNVCLIGEAHFCASHHHVQSWHKMQFSCAECCYELQTHKKKKKQRRRIGLKNKIVYYSNNNRTAVGATAVKWVWWMLRDFAFEECLAEAQRKTMHQQGSFAAKSNTHRHIYTLSYYMFVCIYYGCRRVYVQEKCILKMAMTVEDVAPKRCWCHAAWWCAQQRITSSHTHTQSKPNKTAHSTY